MLMATIAVIIAAVHRILPVGAHLFVPKELRDG